MKKIMILLALVPLISVAQEPLSLKDFRESVVTYNQQLKIAGERIYASQQKSQMVHTGFLPSLAGVVNGNYQVGNKMGFGDMTIKDYNYNANLTLQQTIWAGGAVRAQYDAAKIENQIANSAQKQTLENVIYAADVNYWAYAASHEQLEVAKQYVEIVRSLYTVVGERFQDGYVSKTDMLMVETRYSEARMQEISARKLYYTSLQNINTMLGQHQIVEYDVVDSISAAIVLPKFEGVDKALENRAEYDIAKLNIELQNQNVRLARAQFNPKLAVGLQGVYGTPSLNFTGIAKVYGTAFVQLNVPIFNWGERTNSVNMAKSAVRSMEYSRVDVVDKITGELANSRIGLEQSFAQVDVATHNLEIADENLSLNTFSYREGKLPILDVLQSQLAWIQSFTAYINSNYQYRVAYAEYVKAQGVIL